MMRKCAYTVYGTSRRGTRVGGRSFHMLSLDVTSDASVEAAVGEVMRLEGRIDLLVNNAGFGVAPAGAEESSIEQARSILHGDCRPSLAGCREAAKAEHKPRHPLENP